MEGGFEDGCTEARVSETMLNADRIADVLRTGATACSDVRIFFGDSALETLCLLERVALGFGGILISIQNVRSPNFSRLPAKNAQGVFLQQMQDGFW